MTAGGTIDTMQPRQLLRALAARGYETDDIALRARLGPGELAPGREQMSLALAAELFEDAAAVAGDDLLGLHFAQTRDTRDLGLIGYVGLSSATLALMLENMVRYQRIVGSGLRFDASRLRSDALLTWLADPPWAVQFHEYLAANTLRIVQDATGVPIKPVEVMLAHERAVGRDAFAEQYGCTVHMGAAHYAIRLRHADLGLAVRTADDRLLAILFDLCERVMRELDAAAVAPVVQQVRHTLATLIVRGAPSAGEVARQLGISARTLSRRLAEADTSFNAVLDETRAALAREYLSSGELSNTEIAYLLGYAEPSSFSAACRRWTGQPPSALRQQLRVGAQTAKT